MAWPPARWPSQCEALPGLGPFHRLTIRTGAIAGVGPAFRALETAGATLIPAAGLCEGQSRCSADRRQRGLATWCGL
ncbi:hypothetical protein NDU88_002263 [Pleurodeles waltl]|uniref:Uncharacterized protein n=1 Tax=Pleurodeles waltl TaxID=8319 RepID=A0AAV7VE33_PLEWA|nr:hypothetical protein NDU88_002263 [Pleurodeles waltl]